MGRFTGKCDFQDHIEMRGHIENQEAFEKFKENTKVYIGHGVNEKRLEFETMDDLIPYYTHIISASCSSDGKGSIWLSSKSWLEIEEDRYWPNTYRTERIKKFDEFVRSHGKTPLWATSIEERESWTVCPLGECYYCEPKIKHGTGKPSETTFCPYMYANRKFPCKYQKMLEKYPSLKKD